ncbi:MAG: hypothetical protein AAB609_03835 [Patescibacteria group bacterium]
MTYSNKILSIIFFILIFMMFVKSAANALKFKEEIKSLPVHINIEPCPSKNEDYFKNLKNGGYLYALHRYKSLGVKCKK